MIYTNTISIPQAGGGGDHHSLRPNLLGKTKEKDKWHYWCEENKEDLESQ